MNNDFSTLGYIPMSVIRMHRTGEELVIYPYTKCTDRVWHWKSLPVEKVDEILDAKTEKELEKILRKGDKFGRIGLVGWTSDVLDQFKLYRGLDKNIRVSRI